jgi:PP-loop superfamily ATP-utilizing enzyme
VDEKMTDIVEKLSKYVAGMGTRNPKDYTAFLTVEDAAEAIETIQKLRAALREIGFDYVELSYDKIKYFYLEHMVIARNAYQKSFPEQQPTEHKPLDDNF